ncbi:hypothetical protein GCM10010964_11600 [Caldovatus sediminis]|uniref:Nucleoside phosphorylase domain-containing protein n=1 Tax=Caldovatus sediminis TaxID=2041189 RepID=A0A8J3EBN1_9PROT|nr:nucleoside phosphorylase [Caldovatus sediminis]GGG25256.1 hypothetical protein GCM10010964_11600 [Caldovatus sediminis]
MTAAPLLVVVGMRREAALLPAEATVVCAGGDPRRAARLLQAWAEAPDRAPGGAGARPRGSEDRRAAAAVLSFGIAGALDPALRPGDLLVATELRGAEGAPYPADPGWSAALAAATGARAGPFAGADAVVADAAAKRALRLATGALAVDLESGPAAAFAAARGLPFAALRAVADTAAERIPPAALAGLTPEGRADPLAVLRALARRPGDLADLLRLAARSRAALAALRRAVALLGRDLGRGPLPLALLPFLLLGERLLHVA